MANNAQSILTSRNVKELISSRILGLSITQYLRKCEGEEINQCEK